MKKIVKIYLVFINIMVVKYSIEVSYKVSDKYKYSQFELITGYMDVIKKNPEISAKDSVLNNIGNKYNTTMNSHDFDLKCTDLVTPGIILLRNTNFELNELNVIDFIKDLPSEYSIQFIHKKVAKTHISIYSVKGNADYKKLDELDNQILSILPK